MNPHLNKYFRQWNEAQPYGAIFLCILIIAASTERANGLQGQTESPSLAPRYRIELNLNYRQATFSGVQFVQVTNGGHEELDHLVFHLYPNAGLGETEEPWLTVSRISLNGNDLRSTLRPRHSGLRVDLPTKLAPGRSLELKLEFSARLPRVQREEASLLAHFLQEVNDAVNEEKLSRDARDIFFAGEEAVLLSYFHPMLAVKPSQLSEASLIAGTGGIVFTEAADYEVKITTDNGLTILGSGAETKSDATSNSQQTRVFQGEKLRGFGLVIAERVKSVEQRAGQTRVVSYFREGDDRLGKRALNIAARAVEAYAQAFGNYPYPILQIVEMPLPAGYSGTELPALIALAQAYYIDFEAPGSTRLPGVLREHEDVIKSAFEFTLAHGVAHQWWGSAVGNDPERAPFLNESLSSYSAAYYHEIAYSKAFGERIAKQQLNGTYQAYRMLGGADLEVDKPAKDFRSTLQFSAIVQAKGALLFAALRRELGDEKFFRALKSYYAAQRFRIVTPDQMRGAFLNVAEDPRTVRAIFQRWLREKHGDEDIGAPDLTLLSPPVSKIRTLGRVFVKIGKTAAKPF